VRPLGWDEAATNPALFALSRQWWRSKVDALAQLDYGNRPPDYRRPVRQILFDDTCNMVGNPVQIARQKAALHAAVSGPTGTSTLWLAGADFTDINAPWAKQGSALRAGYGNFNVASSTTAQLAQPGRYAVWVHFGNVRGRYSPWRLNVSGVAQLTYLHNRNDYTSDWEQAGTVQVTRAGAVQLEIAPLPYQAPATYRTLFDVVFSTDADCAPAGAARPALSPQDYRQRAAQLGATADQTCLAWLGADPYTHPLSQLAGSPDAWPPVKLDQLPHEVTLAMPREAERAQQIVLRNLSDRPLTLQVNCSALNGGRSYAGKLVWRVVAFAPYGERSDQWSPLMLLRQPTITVPPLGVAGVWLTISSRGVLPGNYSATVELSGANLQQSVFGVNAAVANVYASPRQAVLVGGYSRPPQGAAYTIDAARHGLNVWYGEMSKAQMQRLGIKLLYISNQAAAPGPITVTTVRARIARLKALGLDYNDWVFKVGDEPHGETEEALKAFIDIARTVRQADARARISFNPGDAATAATFQILEPWCDLWIPYQLHLTYPPAQAAAKRAVFTAKPWLWYTVTSSVDKLPTTPALLFNQIRSVVSQPGQPLGTLFFALYYPMRDGWDTAYETRPDVSTYVLPSRHGPIAGPAYEAIGEATTLANLAALARENGAPAALCAGGDWEQLLGWLHTRGISGQSHGG
jgi:hypothetical protein